MPVAGQRLGAILCGVAAFDCGKQQLLDFAQSCIANGLRLSFVMPNETSSEISDYYVLKSSNLLAADRVVYVSVNPEPPTEDERYIGKLSLATRKISIEKLQTHTLILPPKTIEGYKVGHELSHATAWVKHFENRKGIWNSLVTTNQAKIRTIFERINADPNTTNIPEIEGLRMGGRDLHLGFWKDMFQRFYDHSVLPDPIAAAITRMPENIPEHPLIAQCLNDLWQLEKDNPLQGLDDTLLKILFANMEEARNLLGLGLDKSFSSPGITGELQFLNELVQNTEGTNTKCIRMPYGIKHGDNIDNILKKPGMKDLIMKIFKSRFPGLQTIPITVQEPETGTGCTLM